MENVRGRRDRVPSAVARIANLFPWKRGPMEDASTRKRAIAVRRSLRGGRPWRIAVLLLAGAMGCAAPERIVVREPSREREPSRDLCTAGPPVVTLIEQTAIDDRGRVVAVRVDGEVVGASMQRTLKPQPPVARPVTLPNRPFIDAPAHGPRDFFGEFIASSVAGLLNVTIVSWLPGVPFIELPLSKPVGTLFSDGVLDRDEWHAEVERRAERFRAAERARQAPLEHLVSSCEGSCVLRALVDAHAKTVVVKVKQPSCDVRTVELALPSIESADPAAPKALAVVPEVADTDPRDAAARAQEGVWADLEKEAPPWAPPFPGGCCVRSVFSTSKPRHVGALDGETLVCHVRVKHAGVYDTIGLPDLMVRIAMGHASVAARTFVAPEERGDYTWILPGVHLLVGAKIKLSLVDEDVGNDDWIGAVVQTFDGVMPMRFEHQAFEGECRVRPRGEESRWRTRVARATDGALQGLLRSRDASRPASVDAQIRAQLMDVASAGGWASPEVKALRRRYQALRDEWRRRRMKVMARAITRPGVVGGLRVQPVSDFDCSSGLGCLFDVEVASRTRTRGGGARLANARLKLVDGIGRSAVVRQSFREEGDEVTIDAGSSQRFEMEAALPDDEPPYGLELPDGRILELPGSSRGVAPHP